VLMSIGFTSFNTKRETGHARLGDVRGRERGRKTYTGHVCRAVLSVGHLLSSPGAGRERRQGGGGGGGGGEGAGEPPIAAPLSRT